MREPAVSDGQAGIGQDWTAQAACRGADPEVFTDPTSDQHVREALAICAHCPVARDCLDTALAHDKLGDIGIWGGTTVDVRDRIRAGTLTRDDALHLQTGPHRQHGDRTPILAVTPNDHGDYTDDTGRILITRLPAGDYMTFIDQRPLARTPTLTDACQAAHTARSREPAERPPTRRPSVVLVEVRVDVHGDYVDDSGRILITRVPTEPPYLVFLDNRLHQRAKTLNSARAAAHTALRIEADAQDLVSATPRTSVHATKTNGQCPERRPKHTPEQPSNRNRDVERAR